MGGTRVRSPSTRSKTGAFSLLNLMPLAVSPPNAGILIRHAMHPDRENVRQRFALMPSELFSPCIPRDANKLAVLRESRCKHPGSWHLLYKGRFHNGLA